MKMSIITSLGELIPDFGPLLSFTSPDNLPNSSAHVLAPFISTLQAISLDPLILSKAMLDYLSLFRDARMMNDHDAFVTECSLLNVKHKDLIAAVRAINRSRTTNRVKGTIHSLPVELLAHVFTLSTISRFWEPGEILGEPFDMQLRAVCRLWRDVIDGTPVIWSSVHLKSRVEDFDWLRAVLNRSKSVPLTLDVDITSMDSQLVSILSPEIARARRLYLECDEWAAPSGQIAAMTDDERQEETSRAKRFMQRLINNPAPLLEDLSVDSLDISRRIFSHIIPSRLRKVVLKDCPFVSPTACIFQSVELTSLILKNTTVWESVDDMLVLLHTLPQLQHFRIDIPLFEDSLPFLSPQTFGSKSLRLVHLRHLELAIPLETVALLIPILDFPTSTELVIQGSFRHEPDAESPEFAVLLNDLRSAFQPHFQKMFSNNTSHYDDMHIGCHERFETDDGFSVSMSGTEKSSAGPPDFEFGVLWHPDYQEEYMAIIMEMLSWPGMAHSVASLMVDQTKLLNRESQWRRILDALPALTCVTVYGPNAPAFLRALRLSSSSARALKTVSVNHAEAKAIALMIQTLDRRVEAREPKLELKLSYCDIEVPVLVQLRLHKGVTTVTWDSKNNRGWFSGSDDEGDEESETEMSGEDSMSGSEE